VVRKKTGPPNLDRRGKPRKGKRKPRKNELVLPAVIEPSQEVRVGLLQALADPLDTRSDDEISADTGISLDEIVVLRSDYVFREEVLSHFRKNLDLMEPQVFRYMMRATKRGNVAAARLILESTGKVPGKGIHVHLPAGASSSEDLSGYTSEDLDKEIHQLMMETNPPDIIFSSTPKKTYSVEDADFIEVDDDSGADIELFGGSGDRESPTGNNDLSVSSGEEEDVVSTAPERSDEGES
jgi:hypothetical protein